MLGNSRWAQAVVARALILLGADRLAINRHGPIRVDASHFVPGLSLKGGLKESRPRRWRSFDG